MACSQPAFLARPDTRTTTYAQSRGQSAQRVMAPHQGHNHHELAKSLSRQVCFADDPDRSDCLTAERNLEDYSRCATCSVQCDSESYLPCVQCGAGTCVGCLVSKFQTLAQHATTLGESCRELPHSRDSTKYGAEFGRARKPWIPALPVQNCSMITVYARTSWARCCARRSTGHDRYLRPWPCLAQQ